MIKLNNQLLYKLNKYKNMQVDIHQHFNCSLFEGKLQPFFKKYDFKKINREGNPIKGVGMVKIIRTLSREYIFKVNLYSTELYLYVAQYKLVDGNFSKGADLLNQSHNYLDDIDHINKSLEKMVELLEMEPLEERL